MSIDNFHFDQSPEDQEPVMASAPEDHALDPPAPDHHPHVPAPVPVVAVLSADIANKIAAGECVERPASVVKELVENSLDSGATRITVEMEDGGRSVIRVTDNGHGICRDELVLAVQRHATSKLRDLEDLTGISTLGFRGEALPSIAAVSRLEIISGTASESPNRLEMEGNEILDLSGCGAPVGTTVVVRDLFFNTPARQKFLRSAQTEFGHALEHLTRLSIAHHHVAFRVIHNRREALNTPGAPDPLNSIVAAYGSDTARKMVPVGLDGSPVKVCGYVSHPMLTRSNRTQQSFFVNRRWVRNRAIGHALDQAYRGMLTVGRHPVAAILIEIPPGLVDVNVHPTKAEVRFLREWEVHQAVARAIKDALHAVSLVPDVNLSPGSPAGHGMPSIGSMHSSMPAGFGSQPAVQSSLWEGQDPLRDVAHEPFRGVSSAFDLTDLESEQGAFAVSTAREMGPLEDVELHPEAFPAPVGQGLLQPGFVQPGPFQPGAIPPGAVPGPLNSARVVGQLHRCYIVAETPEGILLVDQHAAHERILYEKFLHRNGDRDAQELVVPITISLGRREAALALDRLEDFRALGFRMEPFGPNTFLVRTVPLFARRVNYEKLLHDLIDDLAGTEFGRRVRVQRERIAASMACRSAVMQGDHLSLAEMEALLNDLRGVNNPLELPTNCPHGRPTAILLTLSQVERLFHRT